MKKNADIFDNNILRQLWVISHIYISNFLSFSPNYIYIYVRPRQLSRFVSGFGKHHQFVSLQFGGFVVAQLVNVFVQKMCF